MRIVLALGGNAIARRGDSLSVEAQSQRIRDAVAALADVARDNELVVTHGNGPQVGLLALQTSALADVEPLPLDVLGAETEGMIGYMLERELASLLPTREVATLLTQVEVSADDPALSRPTKPVGRVFPSPRALELEKRLGWSFVPEAGGLRRVVPSPEPVCIRELRTIELLVGAGVLVVCAGGGGIPVIARSDGSLHGVEAVIDKDRTSALLASALGADVLLLLTDVFGVYEDWPEPRGQPLARATVERLRALDLDEGSMGPKVEAACRFAEAGGRAAIGPLEDALRVLEGTAGTQVCVE